MNGRCKPESRAGWLSQTLKVCFREIQMAYMSAASFHVGKISAGKLFFSNGSFTAASLQPSTITACQ